MRIIFPITAVMLGLPLITFAEDQSLSLLEGTNMISFTVLPVNPSPASVFSLLGPNFIEAASYDALSGDWAYYRAPQHAGAAEVNSFNSLAMGPVAVGKGYLVRMSAAMHSVTITGSAPSAPSVTIHPGWNLVGFPVGSKNDGIGLRDLLNSPRFSFSTAAHWNTERYLPFTESGILDNLFLQYSPGQGLWVFSEEASSVTWTPEAILAKPLVYFENPGPIIVEAPILSEDGTANRQLNVRFSRQYSGNLRFMVSGSAQPSADFTVTSANPQISPTNSLGTLAGLNMAQNAVVPIQIQFPRRISLQTNSSIMVTLRRPAESSSVADSASLPQTAQVTITDGRNGIYDGLLSTGTSAAALNGQNMRVALRSSGRAVFEATDGGLLFDRFTLPYNLVSGIPQFSGSLPVTLPSTSALGRSITVTLTPGPSVDLRAHEMDTIAFEVPIRLTFANLIGGTSQEIAAKLTFTQASPAL